MAQTGKHLLLITLALLLAASVCLGQSANAAQSQAPAPASSPVPAESAKGHGVMPVELTKSLDSKKLKEGDPVTGRIAADLRLKDGTSIPRGSKVTGHVTESKARSKGDAQSALGIVFDKISLPGGKDLAIKGEIQAIAPNPNSSTPEASSGSVGPGMMAGHEGASAGTTPPTMSSAPASPQEGRQILTGQSKGVIGFHNLELGENSVLISTGKNVSLDSGTQMMIQVEIE
jgi:hypothetical protein